MVYWGIKNILTNKKYPILCLTKKDAELRIKFFKEISPLIKYKIIRVALIEKKR